MKIGCSLFTTLWLSLARDLQCYWRKTKHFPMEEEDHRIYLVLRAWNVMTKVFRWEELVLPRSQCHEFELTPFISNCVLDKLSMITGIRIPTRSRNFLSITWQWCHDHMGMSFHFKGIKSLCWRGTAVTFVNECRFPGKRNILSKPLDPWLSKLRFKRSF